MRSNLEPRGAVRLDARGIEKTYASVAALKGLTFELRAGEILGLLGPNGAGKTTAIRVLTTVLPVSAGHFTLMDIPDSRPEEIRALVGVLPESNGFPAHMTGAAYLTCMGRLYGRPRADAEAKARELLTLFGLAAVAQNRIATYSRGMRQRLAISRALVNDPKVLFLDEPTLGFDPKGQQEMLQVIREAAEVDHVAVVLSSHLLEVVEPICHRVLILDRGRVLADGPVAEIKRRVAAPRTCRVQTTPDALPRALTLLSGMIGVSVERHADRNDELLVAFDGAREDGALNDVLQHLIRADIPIEAFSRESIRLTDAFLSMIEEGRA
jgi:ABC-2 type transport system ATP-binding protein